MTKTEAEICKDLADALYASMLVATCGFNKMPKSRIARDAIEGGLAAIATYRAFQEQKRQQKNDHIILAILNS